MDLKETAEKLRAQAEAQSVRGTRWRFDDAFREQVVAYVRARQEEGGTQEEAARELGLSAWTMSRWSRQRKPKKQSAASGGGFHPVAVKREAQASEGALVVHGPGGMRVEGLTLKQVALLLRELEC
jgi:transposase-like protein